MPAKYYLSTLKAKSCLRLISKRSGVIALLLGVCAITFSIYFVLFYKSIADNIVQIEIDGVSSNTEIQANMISKIFAKSVESVVDNLWLISNAPSVQNGDRGGVDLLGLAEHNKNNFTYFYVLLDSEGKITGS